MKILLTGGSGFIGRNIKESYLCEKYVIVAPSRQELDCTNDDSVEKFFSQHSFDVVIHSGAKPGHRNASDVDNILYPNSRMMFNILKYKDSWGKLINMGSGAIYGMEHYQPKMKEEYFGVHIPKDEHGYNKYIFGHIFPKFKDVVDFRIFGIFGKYEDYTIRFISNAICKVLFGLPITLRQDRRFDYLFIDDLIPILEHFINTSWQHDAYNITPDLAVNLSHAAELVRSISGKSVDLIIAKQGLGVEYSGDNSRLHNEIKDLEFTPLTKSIESTYAWYASHKSQIDPSKLLNDK